MGVTTVNNLNLDSYPAWMAYLRHELYTPLNAIHGYTELLLEELEDSDIIILEFEDLLHELNKRGSEIYTIISNSLSSDLNKSKNAKSWSTIQAYALRDKLFPHSQALQHILPLLQASSPPDHQEDVKKISLAIKHFCGMLQVAIAAQDWPFKLPELNQFCEDEKEIICQSKKIDTLKVCLDCASSSTPKNVSECLQLEKEVLLAKKLQSKPNSQQLAKPATILVVDDNGANCDLLCRYITRQGHVAVPVSCGKAAVEKIKAGHYDLVLLDILMPEMNGYQVLEWIRHSEWNYLSVIMISSLDEIDSVVKCIEMGAEDYLPKPFNPTLLKARVDACLEKKHLRDQEIDYVDQLAQANSKITSLNTQLQAENIRLSAELDVTRRIQQMMLPKQQELEKILDLEVVGFMKPADEVGGDYYDIIHHGNSVIVGIGDVTGHGLESGLLMIMLQTAVRTLIEKGEEDACQFLSIINRAIVGNIERMETTKNSSLSLIRYSQGKLKISGQHEEVIIIRKAGKIERVDTTNLGFPIGLENEIGDFIGQREVDLNLGDIVVLYTDGITEAENLEGNFYGIEKLCNVAQRYRHKTAAGLRDEIIRNLSFHIGEQQVYDDITLVVMKRNL